jgi:hypothetical protein
MEDFVAEGKRDDRGEDLEDYDMHPLGPDRDIIALSTKNGFCHLSYSKCKL